MQKETHIRIIVIEPNRAAELRTIENNLAAMQAVVGGRIEIVPFSADRTLEAICNEDFLATHQPDARIPSGYWLGGTFFVAAPVVTPDDIIYRSLSDDEADELLAMFNGATTLLAA